MSRYFRVATSLYVHIPFCESKCRYCAFNSVGRSLWSSSLIDQYLEGLDFELATRSSALDSTKTIFIGGGTPSVLDVEQLARLFDILSRYVRLAPDAEITTEMNPGSVHDEKLSLLHERGVNRISLGAQTFDQRRLEFLDRVHVAQDVFRSVEALRSAGFVNFNVDLIFGLPQQGLEGFIEDLHLLSKLECPHVSLYNLQFEEGTELERMRRRGDVRVEDEDVQLEMYESGVRRMSEIGLHQYEISNFSRTGFECRHNLNYWTNESYIGVGAGAWGCDRGRRYRNVNEVGRYLELVSSNVEPVSEFEELSLEASMKETVITGLRMRRGIDLRTFRHRFDSDVMDVWKDQIRHLMDLGLLECTNEQIYLTDAGVLVSNEVFSFFI